MSKILIYGYGNPDREDDGVAWHVLKQLSNKLGLQAPETPDDEFIQSGEFADIMFDLQIIPELAETLSKFDKVCFIDAHTGNISKDIQLIEINSEFKTSPFTHHMTPTTCLAIAETMYNHKPEAILVSIRGYQFGFSQSLSPKTQELAYCAAEMIWSWIQQEAK